MYLSRFILLFICLTLALPFSTTSFAQDGDMMDTSKACTMPRDNYPVGETDERWKYCNIHMRQFAYREKNKELTQMLRTRAENYKAISKNAKDAYKIELQKHYDSLGD